MSHPLDVRRAATDENCDYRESQFSCQICLGFPHTAVDSSVVVVALPEIDADEPSAVASCNDLANFASHRDFLLGSQETRTLSAHSIPDEGRNSSVDWNEAVFWLSVKWRRGVLR